MDGGLCGHGAHCPLAIDNRDPSIATDLSLFKAILVVNFTFIMLLAFAMSTAAHGAPVAEGRPFQFPPWGGALRTGFIFGVIEGFAPVIGGALVSTAAQFATDWNHWISFALLAGVGVHMIYAGLRPAHDEDASRPRRRGHAFWIVVVTGLAAGIDAMTAGVVLASHDESIVPGAALIGITTLVMVTAGVMLGRIFARAAGKRAEILGGVLIFCIGAVILRP